MSNVGFTASGKLVKDDDRAIDGSMFHVRSENRKVGPPVLGVHANRFIVEHAVRELILDKNARIITFNYDTMQDENVFTHVTRSGKYGEMTVAGINGYPVATGAAADLVLIKPHGSLYCEMSAGRRL